MKGRSAIRFRQWLAITLSTLLVAWLSIFYDISMRHMAVAEKISPSLSFANNVALNLAGALVAGALIGAFMVHYLQDRFSDKSIRVLHDSPSYHFNHGNNDDPHTVLRDLCDAAYRQADDEP
ncbi:MAG: hypothetical protein K1X63_08475 [Chitinophagales bacterium]|nr:hypothetical protein [Chitinophagales bacterium]